MMSILANYLKRAPGLVVPRPLFAAEQFLSIGLARCSLRRRPARGSSLPDMLSNDRDELPQSEGDASCMS